MSRALSALHFVVAGGLVCGSGHVLGRGVVHVFHVMILALCGSSWSCKSYSSAIDILESL